MVFMGLKNNFNLNIKSSFLVYIYKKNIVMYFQAKFEADKPHDLEDIKCQKVKFLTFRWPKVLYY